MIGVDSYYWCAGQARDLVIALSRTELESQVLFRVTSSISCMH